MSTCPQVVVGRQARLADALGCGNSERLKGSIFRHFIDDAHLLPYGLAL